MATQNIQKIKVKDLHLWSENPRAPVDPNSSDYDIIKHAIDTNPKEWNLDRLVQQMGDHYDFSELPTVVYIDDKPIVYDGNRRIAVLKYLQNKNLYSSLSGRLYLNDGPEELRNLYEVSCNICDKDTALTNIERKHVNNGSWGTLQREYFRHKHRGKPKSLFLMIEEQTNLISCRATLNQGFVKDEVLTEKNLNKLGFGVKNGKLVSNYEDEQQIEDILEKIASLVEKKNVTTRKNRGELKQIFLQKYPNSKKIVKPYDESGKTTVVKNKSIPSTGAPKHTPLTKQDDVIFGRKLTLEKGPVNDLYRGICAIYEKFDGQQNILPIIAMSLRLLLDTAARDYFIKKGENEIAEQDNAYKEFLKEVKKVLSKKRESSLSLTNSWLSEERNIEATLAKYAHNNIVCKKGDIIEDSKIIADILEYFFNKE